MTNEHHDVIVESEGSGIGTILGIILAVVVVLAIVWFFFLGGMGNNTQPADQTQIEIQLPDGQPPAPEQPAPPAY